MKHPKETPTTGRGSVRPDELLTMREAGRRLGFASRSLCDFQRQGLRTILAGRVKLILGRDLLTFVAKLADEQAQHGGDGND